MIVLPCSTRMSAIAADTMCFPTQPGFAAVAWPGTTQRAWRHFISELIRLFVLAAFYVGHILCKGSEARHHMTLQLHQATVMIQCRRTIVQFSPHVPHHGQQAIKLLSKSRPSLCLFAPARQLYVDESHVPPTTEVPEADEKLASWNTPVPLVACQSKCFRLHGSGVNEEKEKKVKVDQSGGGAETDQKARGGGRGA